MKRNIMMWLAALFALWLLSPGLAIAQELPPGPEFTVNQKFDAVAPEGAYELVSLVMDFAPGAWTPLHSHGGQVFVTVLAGTMTVRAETEERTYGAGSSWVEMPGDKHAAGNATGETARLLVTVLLPQGAALTTTDDTGATDELPPGPTLVYQARTPGPVLTGALDVVQLVADFAPGAWTPPHEHGGRGVVTVLSGRLSVKDASGERIFGPGESWVEGEGEVAAVGGADGGRLAASFVMRRGATLTTVREAITALPGLPQTGGGPGLGPNSGAVALAGVLFAMLLSSVVAWRFTPRAAAAVRRWRSLA